MRAALRDDECKVCKHTLVQRNNSQRTHANQFPVCLDTCASANIYTLYTYIQVCINTYIHRQHVAMLFMSVLLSTHTARQRPECKYKIHPSKLVQLYTGTYLPQNEPKYAMILMIGTTKGGCPSFCETSVWFLEPLFFQPNRTATTAKMVAGKASAASHV